VHASCEASVFDVTIGDLLLQIPDLWEVLVRADTEWMRHMRQHRSSGLGRSLTLLRTFLIASAAILAAGAVALSSALTGDLRRAALGDTALDVGAYTDAVLATALVRKNRLTATPAARRQLDRIVRRPTDMLGVNVYAREGRLAYSTTHHDRVGRPRTSADLVATVESGAPSAEIVDSLGDGAGVVKVWAPIHSSSGRVLGAAEVTLDDSAVNQIVEDAHRTVWYAVGLVFGVLWLVLALLVRGASARMHAQHDDLESRSHDLVESSRELEATLLETIETLNAAVEARDPYTAGHSQRVRRISLAIGRELRLPARQLGALATAALFHDIGKIGMPDSILTKPGKLDRSEAAVMREHVTRGAEIVSRISSLRDSVPAIRHHHERWDGLGYPDRLGGTDIPVEASIIAIADAWDAMTTDRPYAVALDVDEALLQIQAGRGKQFNPAVVDAFLSVTKRRPAEVMPPEPSAAAVAATG
jgi:putative nucleotidyltransferase with HDIG domain